MTRIPWLMSLVYDLRSLVVLLGVVAAIALVVLGRCVVAVAQDVVGSMRRLWD
jgi:hypothetical protein